MVGEDGPHGAHENSVSDLGELSPGATRDMRSRFVPMPG